MGLLNRLVNGAIKALPQVVKALTSTKSSPSRTAPKNPTANRPLQQPGQHAGAGRPSPKPAPEKKALDEGARRTERSYPGDFTGTVRFEYAPTNDRTGDPGEVAWALVPYEDDPSQGKVRPLLLIGRDGEWLLGLPLTSKDHDRDEEQEARAGRYWADLGSGEWDPKGRPSEVRLNRVVRVDPSEIQFRSVALDEARFREIERAAGAVAGR